MAEIGSKQWFDDLGNRVLGAGLASVQAVLQGTTTPSGLTTTTATKSVTTGGILPYVIGGAAIIGIALILWKR